MRELVSLKTDCRKRWREFFEEKLTDGYYSLLGSALTKLLNPELLRKGKGRY